jgi:inhibitor of KinA sporulation pathway (predicted exonuclease)
MSERNQYDYVVALDLEMNQPSGTIIQIGLAVGQLSTKQIIDTASILIRPDNEDISEYIAKLTGITNDAVKDAPGLGIAYKQMCEFLKKYSYRKQVITWGGGDQYELNKQLNAYWTDFSGLQRENIVPQWPFGYTCMNVKNIHQFLQESHNRTIQGGLAKSLGKYQLQFIGRKHDAKDDAYNTLRLYFHLLNIVEGL